MAATHIGKRKNPYQESIEDLYPGGATPGESGILSAYRLAKANS
jgi:Ca-activated chloride channel family protein